jgi:uncharacterized protein YfiM (DUF2279 family)
MKRLIAGITAGLVLALPLPASAQSIGEDKVDHFAAGMMIDYVGAAMCPKSTAFERFLAVAVVAGCKEWYDHNHSDRHSAEWGDFAATCIGGLTGEGTIWIMHKEW